MPSLEDPRSNKRQRNCFESALEVSTPSVKKSKTAESTCDHRPPRFWDTLSKIRLSRGAIREFERRTADTARQQQIPRSLDYQSLAAGNLGQLERFSRHGGPDLAHLRGVRVLQHDIVCTECADIESQFATSAPVEDSMSSRGRKRPSAPSRSKGTTKPRSSPYDGDFEQKLIDGGIYPEGYEHSKDEPLNEPVNLADIQRALRVPRASLSPSRFSEAAFKEFKRRNRQAVNEASAMADVIPIIAGEGRMNYRSVTDAPFTNMSPILEDVTVPKPDMYDGARPEQIDRRVRHSLGSYIVPSKKTNYPAAPNFYLEGKSAAGRADVAMRQACYDGAVGARAMHSLQNYGAPQPTYDENAYSYSNIYHAGSGTLQTYGTHLTRPRAPGGRPEYHMTLLDGAAMTLSKKSFCEGVTVFRNARDLAESNRNSFIENANRAARHDPPPSSSTMLTESHESRSVLYDDLSETSADELAADDPVMKRHRHDSSRGHITGVRPPNVLIKSGSQDTNEGAARRRDDTASNHNGSSCHAVAEVREEAKRRVKPTQKLMDSRSVRK